MTQTLFPEPVPVFDLHSYDHYIVTFSGGKDSTAMLLHLLELGVPKEKIELWHHLVDGKDDIFFDWECTEDYCRKFGQAFGIPVYFSWKQDGFEGEMLRENRKTRPNYYEVPSGVIDPITGMPVKIVLSSGGIRGKDATRLKFPQVSPDLSVRWCSAYLKIDVCTAAINNQARFKGKRVLVLSGERAQESTARANYKFFEPDRSHGGGRHVDRCRIIHNWQESDVWGIIERWKVVVHPCYYIGYGRCSCKWCIFGNDNQVATSMWLSPAQGQKMSGYEIRFGTTIKRDKTLMQQAERGKPYEGVYLYPDKVEQALSKEYAGAIFTENWSLPLGAYGESAGPV